MSNQYTKPTAEQIQQNKKLFDAMHDEFVVNTKRDREAYYATNKTIATGLRMQRDTPVQQAMSQRRIVFNRKTQPGTHSGSK